jgi:hypothetical protein
MERPGTTHLSSESTQINFQDFQLVSDLTQAVDSEIERKLPEMGFNTYGEVDLSNNNDVPTLNAVLRIKKEFRSRLIKMLLEHSPLDSNEGIPMELIVQYYRSTYQNVLYGVVDPVSVDEVIEKAQERASLLLPSLIEKNEDVHPTPKYKYFHEIDAAETIEVLVKIIETESQVPITDKEKSFLTADFEGTYHYYRRHRQNGPVVSSLISILDNLYIWRENIEVDWDMKTKNWRKGSPTETILIEKKIKPKDERQKALLKNIFHR